MKKQDTTKTFSIRTETESLTEFENVIQKNGTNKNKLINEFMLQYIVLNSKPYESINTDIHNNIENLGYQKEFFNRSDAEFFIQAENVLNDTPAELLDENDVLRVLSTGVKYSFLNIGLKVYSSWMFYESKENETNKLHLNFGNINILYDEKSDVVTYMDKMDFTAFSFNK